MADGRKNNGGARRGAGRKRKADETDMLQKMDIVKAPMEVWEALAKRIDKGDTVAIVKWLEYRYGKPNQLLDVTTNGKELPNLTFIPVQPKDD